MIPSMRNTRMRMAKSRTLSLEALETRLCLSTYTTVDLIPLLGHNDSRAIGLNDNGMVVGRSYGVSDEGISETECVVWSVDPMGDVSVSPLPGVDGEQTNNAVEVNNQGMIAGSSYVTVDGDSHEHAVVWTATTPGSYLAHDLGTLGEYFVSSRASSVSEPDSNGNVWVVGRSTDGSNIDHGVLWQVDSQGEVLLMTDLEPSDSDVLANDVKVIGNSVVVAGRSAEQAVIWETTLVGNVVTVVERTELGTADYNAVLATAINNDGDVAGYGFDSGSGPHTGFLYESGDGVITVLESLGNAGNWVNSGTYPTGINDNDVVVGQYDKYVRNNILKHETHAFVWEDGTTHNLLDLVSDDTFCWLASAYDVNDNGEIVGIGLAGKRNDSETHAFLARPEDAGGQHAPVANDDDYTMQPDTTLFVAAPGVLDNDTDADGDPMTAVLDAGPSSGTLALNADGSFEYTPNSGVVGTYTFTYLANDGQDDSNLATVTINVQEVPSGELSIDDVQQNEGKNRTTKFTFTVSLSESFPTPVTVDYATADGSATAGQDYTSATGTLTFAPGETTKTIDVLAKGDRTAEPDETFFVNLSNESGATIGDGQGVGTILNDDGAAPLANFGGPGNAAGIPVEQGQQITPLTQAMWKEPIRVVLPNDTQVRRADLAPGELANVELVTLASTPSALDKPPRNSRAAKTRLLDKALEEATWIDDELLDLLALGFGR